MHCLFVLYFFIFNLDLIPNFVLLSVIPPPWNVPSALKSMLLKGKEFCPIFAFMEPRFSRAQQISECTQQISECTNSLRSYWTWNFRSYISLPTLQQSNKQILFIMTQSLQFLYLSKYYRRGRYLYALMQLVNASHRLLLPAWRHFSFPRDTHGKPVHNLEVCPWGHPWPMTGASGEILTPLKVQMGLSSSAKDNMKTHFYSGSPFFLLFCSASHP